MRHYTLYCEMFDGTLRVGQGIQHEGNYEYEMQAVKDMTERAQTLLATGNYDSVWMHVYCTESGGQRDVKKWRLTKGEKPRVVDAHGAIHYDTNKTKGN